MKKEMMWMNSPEKMKIDLRNVKCDIEAKRMGAIIEDHDAFQSWKMEATSVIFLCLLVMFILGWIWGGVF